jgi:hypothetical protein
MCNVIETNETVATEYVCTKYTKGVQKKNMKSVMDELLWKKQTNTFRG